MQYLSSFHEVFFRTSAPYRNHVDKDDVGVEGPGGRVERLQAPAHLEAPDDGTSVAFHLRPLLRLPQECPRQLPKTVRQQQGHVDGEQETAHGYLKRKRNDFCSVRSRSDRESTNWRHQLKTD